MPYPMSTQRRDRREYPRYLRQYEVCDAVLLPIAAEMGEFDYDDLEERISVPSVRASEPFWLLSAEWRDLIQRIPLTVRAPLAYTVTDKGRTAARTAA